jgi:hypothetical protein
VVVEDGIAVREVSLLVPPSGSSGRGLGARPNLPTIHLAALARFIHAGVAGRDAARSTRRKKERT